MSETYFLLEEVTASNGKVIPKHVAVEVTCRRSGRVYIDHRDGCDQIKASVTADVLESIPEQYSLWEVCSKVNAVNGPWGNMYLQQGTRIMVIGTRYRKAYICPQGVGRIYEIPLCGWRDFFRYLGMAESRMCRTKCWIESGDYSMQIVEGALVSAYSGLEERKLLVVYQQGQEKRTAIVATSNLEEIPLLVSGCKVKLIRQFIVEGDLVRGNTRRPCKLHLSENDIATVEEVDFPEATIFFPQWKFRCTHEIEYLEYVSE